MTVRDEVLAVRSSAVLAAGDHIACARVRGRDAQEAVDLVSPRELFVRPGQMLHTLLLDDAARPVADVYVCCDEDDYLIVAEGPGGPDLARYLADRAGGLDVEIDDLSRSHAFVSLAGPYAWEVLAEVASPDVIGLPYLGFYHEGRFTCFRAGKTGEYGYDLMVERDRLAGVVETIRAAGRRFDLRTASLEALDLCALESWFFNVRREARDGLTPIELQLQWRVSYGRAFTGADALAARRHQATRRAVLIAAGDEMAEDAPVFHCGREVGRTLHTGPSHTRGDWLGVALLDRALAHAEVTGFVSRGPAGDVAVRTLSAPAVNNRSLFVDPQRHSYLTREDDEFPPLVR
ncbi:MAG TPA: hypothetical protein VKB80_08595, partial [Kofleriaceae bacterium]|nr:hypothetical protein [Kofleriaceae bacterium]